jgi:hypothetical protein
MTGKSGSQASQQQPQPKASAEQTNLDGRYHEIGIEAVAAAARYAGGGKARPRAAPNRRSIGASWSPASKAV